MSKYSLIALLLVSLRMRTLRASSYIEPDVPGYIEDPSDDINDQQKGVKFNLPPESDKKRTRSLLDLYDIPEAFDARNSPLRQEWTACPSINQIRNQGICSTCYAHSTSSVISDRLCIAGLKAGKTGKDLFTGSISAHQTSTCVYGRTPEENCNTGGKPRYVYRHAGLYGLPTGKEFRSSPLESCVPVRYNGNSETIKKPIYLSCEKKCDDEHGYKTMPMDLQTIDSYWVLDGSSTMTADEIADNVKRMQREIMNNGPITAAMNIKGFSDFFNHKYDSTKDGVYAKADQPDVEPRPNHGVRIVGWGVSKGLDKRSPPARRSQSAMPYWIVANSYGIWFGDDGFFRVERGANAYNIETQLSAPLISYINPCATKDFCSADKVIDQAVWTDIRDPNKPIFLFQGQCVQQVKFSGEQKLVTVGPAVLLTKRFFLTLPRDEDAKKTDSYRGTFNGFWLFESGSVGGYQCDTEKGSSKFLCVLGRGPDDPSAQVCMASTVDSGRKCYTYKLGTTVFDESSGLARSDEHFPEVGNTLKRAPFDVRSFLHLGSSNIAVFGTDAAKKSVVATLTNPPAATGRAWTLSDPHPISSLLTCSA